MLMAAAMAVACANAQLSLDDCKRMARDNYPAVRQYRLIALSRDYTVANAAKGYLPQIGASAGAAFFTDIVDAGGQHGSPDIGNELYDVALTVNQTIYDGGAIAAGKRAARAEAEVSRTALDVTMRTVSVRVEELFFGLLTIDDRLSQNLLLQKDLGIALENVRQLMAGGVANQNDADAVAVEMAKARQAESGLRAQRAAYAKMLATFIGRPIGGGDSLARPAMPADTTLALRPVSRPELTNYAARNSLLDANRSRLDAALMPKLAAFGIAAYHNKPLAMLNNGLLAAGVTLNWNIGALYTRKNDLRKLDTERQRIGAERDVFLFDTDLQTHDALGRIDNLRRQIALDDEIIALRTAIRQRAEARVGSGTETVNEMLRDINAVSEARLSKALHTTMLLKETHNLMNIRNY